MMLHPNKTYGQGIMVAQVIVLTKQGSKMKMPIFQQEKHNSQDQREKLRIFIQ